MPQTARSVSETKLIHAPVLTTFCLCLLCQAWIQLGEKTASTGGDNSRGKRSRNDRQRMPSAPGKSKVGCPSPACGKLRPGWMGKAFCQIGGEVESSTAWGNVCEWPLGDAPCDAQPRASRTYSRAATRSRAILRADAPWPHRFFARMRGGRRAHDPRRRGLKNGSTAAS